MSAVFLSCIFFATIIIDCLQASASNNTLKQFGRSRRSDECGECGQALYQDDAPLIINGEVVQPPNKYPWVVSLVHSGLEDRFCGGSIITERFILTAAHCLRIKDAEISDDMGNGKCQTDKGKDNCLMEPHEIEILFLDDTRGSVSQVFTSPDYVADTPYSHDVGLIRLQDPIQCDEYKRFICLPEAEHTVKQDSGTKMIITGWGVMHSESMSESDDLREIQVTIKDNKECDVYGWVPEHEKNAYCVTTKGVGSPCFGDSGGNLFALQGGKNIVYGVATAVYSKDCSPEWPSLFTSVVAYMSFITEVINAG